MGQPTTVIPTLETARLRLRAHRVDDLPACIAMWGDPVVTRHIGGRPFTREETWGRVLRYAGHWALLGFGYWVIEELASRRFVGEIGFSDFKRDLAMDLGGAPEIGWALATGAHGQGYATEAVRAALAWAELRFPTPRTVCLIDPDNLASLRVAEKCGYRELARVTYKGLPTLLLER
ncbi:MAG: GNAT family N-acetyltransferase [Deltaproteobacteria bacterium]|nr:GNAT family N-acetyltransferase [Deltaproteobacteria bacterium]